MNEWMLPILLCPLKMIILWLSFLWSLFCYFFIKFSVHELFGFSLFPCLRKVFCFLNKQSHSFYYRFTPMSFSEGHCVYSFFSSCYGQPRKSGINNKHSSAATVIWEARWQYMTKQMKHFTKLSNLRTQS